jgi:hypothetical protein
MNRNPRDEVKMAERIFRMFSLGFLSVGFLVAIAGADKDGPQDLANATTDLIQHVSVAQEAHMVNGATSGQSNKGISLTSETNYVAKAEEVSDASQPATPKNPAPAKNMGL